jgi:hypothetical protein
MDEIRRGFVLQDRGEVGKSPEEDLGRGRRRVRLATVAFSFWRWLMVRAIHGGSPMVVKGKTGSAQPGEAPCAGGKAWESMVWRGVDDGLAWKR